MFEPAPRKVVPPTEEPQIRVGLVLAEDKINSIKFRNKSESGEISINPKSDGLVLNNSVGINKYQLNSDELLSPNTGTTLSPIIAGRNFHWRKEIQGKYPGQIEILYRNGIEVINQLSFEDYLACVITSEMGAACPIEFMKAQVVAARSWAYVFLHDKHPGSNFDVCNDDDCQRYQGSTFLSEQALKASQETKGEFLVCQNEAAYILPAYYYKSCGGYSDNTQEILGFFEPSLVPINDCPVPQAPNNLDFKSFIDLPKSDYKKFYCGQAEDLPLKDFLGKVDEGGSHFRWHKKVSREDLVLNLVQKLGLEDIEKIIELIPVSRTKAGRITEIKLIYRKRAGTNSEISIKTQYKIRETLSPSFLPSSAFLHTINQDGSVDFYGAGWGHGVGLCQVGALMMALSGKNYREILQHYFPASRLTKSY